MNNTHIFHWGILGPGKIANKFAQGLLSLPNASLYAVGSRNYDRAQDFGKRYGAVKMYGNYEDLAIDKDVDIVYIATPHSEHYQHVKLCLESGKHVLCEKAFTINSKQLEHLVKLSRENRLFLMEALWTRFLPTIEKSLEIINSGKIGNLKMLHADFGFQAPYDMNSRIFNPALGGGSLLDIGIYPLFLSLLIFGKPEEIKAVACLGKTGVDESMAIILKYKNGRMAILNSSFIVKTMTNAEIYGTKGHIILNPRWFSQTTLTLCQHEKEPVDIKFNYKNNGYNYEAEEVMKCISEGLTESPKLPLAFSLDLMRIMDNIREQIGVKYDADNN